MHLAFKGETSARYGVCDGAKAPCCLQGWFDDRVEARNALAKVDKLWQISNFDRAELPWMDAGEREGRLFNEAEV